MVCSMLLKQALEIDGLQHVVLKEALGIDGLQHVALKEALEIDGLQHFAEASFGDRWFAACC